MIYQLFIILLLLFLISYFTNKKDIIAPSVIFSLSFLFSSIWAVAYSNIWELNSLSLETLIIIVGGVIIFQIMSILIRGFMSFKTEKRIKENNKFINIDFPIKIMCMIFEVVTIILVTDAILKISNEPLNRLRNAILKYNNLVKFSNTEVSLPKMAGRFKIIVNAMVYWYLYVFINNYLVQKKIDKMCIIIIILGLSLEILIGGRGGIINVILAAISMGILIGRKKGKNKNINLPLKTKLIIIAIPIIVIVAFPKMSFLVGRNIKEKPMYYLAIYCGAEIKNLDTYVKNKSNWGGTTEKNFQTILYFMQWIGPKIGIDVSNYKAILPFQYINGYGLGNVYTTFYPFYYDFGYTGVFVFTIIMAVIVQITYEKASMSALKNKPSIWILTYGYMFSSIVFSFFSNRFYQQNINKDFIYALLLWNIFNYFFTKYKIKFK